MSTDRTGRDGARAQDAGPLEGARERRGAIDVWRGHFETFDGLKLFYARWTSEAAEASAGPVVVLMHGYGEHVERYDELAAALVEAGHPVCGLDARGHGQSDGRRAHVEGYGDYVEDLRLFISHVELRYEGRVRVLLGHSNGGLIATRYAQTYPETLEGLLLSGPLMGLRLKVPAWKAAAGKLLSRVWPTLALPNEIAPEQVSRSPEVVRAYADDPLVNRVATARYFTEMQEAIKRAHAGARAMRLPTLVLQGGGDQIVDPLQTQALAEAMGGDDVTHRELDGLYHEIFNEPERAEVFSQVIDWLGERFGAASTRAASEASEATEQAAASKATEQAAAPKATSAPPAPPVLPPQVPAAPPAPDASEPELPPGIEETKRAADLAPLDSEWEE